MPTAEKLGKDIPGMKRAAAFMQVAAHITARNEEDDDPGSRCGSLPDGVLWGFLRVRGPSSSRLHVLVVKSDFHSVKQV